jgi:hypothetical protein
VAGWRALLTLRDCLTADRSRYGRSGVASLPARSARTAHKVRVGAADNQRVNLEALPTWAEPVADPFRRDPAFWRAVFASADALVLIVLAGLASWLVGRLGGSTVLLVVPFLLPLIFVGWALVSSSRSSRASRVWFRRQASLDAVGKAAEKAADAKEDGLSTWRDAERQAVASVFVRALFRNRLHNP